MRLESSVLCAALIAGSLALSSCVSQERSESPDEAVDSQEQAIINGEFDNSRQAVVMLASRGSLCSGTIIQTDPDQGIGWVLTAAHCVTNSPEAILQGNNFNDPDFTYRVIDFEDHPAYSPQSSAFDFAVVRFAGASRNTPVIPAVGNSDGLGRGDNITSVGYGRITPSNQNGGNNSRRRQITRPLSRLDERFLVYRLNTGGICSGDSGGPVLANINGSEMVVGVHSSVTNDCQGEGFNGRVSGVFDTWLAGALSGQVEDSCELCQQVAQSGDGACTPVINNCFDTPACAQLANCLANCTTDACSQQCVSNNRDGFNDYTAIFDCVCDDACAVQCNGDPACPEGPACGLSFQDETCNTCQENACCSQTEACSNDTTCLACISGEESRSVCDANPAFSNFFGCLENSCGDECGLVNECGFAVEDDACGACLEGSCCAQGTACADESSCLDCIGGEGENCGDNANLTGLLTCLSECDDNPCNIDLGEDPNPDGNPDANPDNTPDPFADPDPDNNPDSGPGGGFVGEPDQSNNGFADDDGGFVNPPDANAAPPSALCSAASPAGPASPGALLLLLLIGVPFLRRQKT